jgi:hypothetical protein
MVEFIGAFLGALCGVFIPVGIVMYKVHVDIKKQFKELTNIAMLTSTVQMDIKHEI